MRTKWIIVFAAVSWALAAGGNFVYAALHHQEWRVPMERGYFQIIPIVVFILFVATLAPTRK